MLRCKDNSIYTGITTDIARRMKEHFNKEKRCAKYTLTHSAKKLEALWVAENKSLASKLEFNIKKLKKQEKENLINSIVNTVTELNEVNKVKFLVNGQACNDFEEFYIRKS